MRILSLLLCLFSCYGMALAQPKLSLREILQEVQQNNQYLKIEQLNLPIAQTDIQTAQLLRNPTLNLQILQLLERNQFGKNTLWHHQSNRQDWWQFTKEFRLPAQRKLEIRLAEKNAILAQKNYKESQRNLLVQSAYKCLELWIAQKQLEIIDIAQSNIDSLLSIQRVKYRNQVVTQTDLLRIELLSKQYDLLLKNARVELRNHQNELSFLLGYSTKDEPRTFEIADDFEVGLLDFDSLITLAEEQRSDIEAAQALIGVTQTNAEYQKKLAYPMPTAGLIWNPQNLTPYLGIYADIPIPLFDRNQGNRRKALLEKKQAEENLLLTQERLQTEIRTAYANYELQKQNVEDFKNFISESQSILDNVRYAFLKGGTTIVDFLEAQRSWLETRQQYYEILEKYRKSYIDLLYVTGYINLIVE